MIVKSPWCWGWPRRRKCTEIISEAWEGKTKGWEEGFGLSALLRGRVKESHEACSNTPELNWSNTSHHATQLNPTQFDRLITYLPAATLGQACNLARSPATSFHPSIHQSVIYPLLVNLAHQCLDKLAWATSLHI